VSSHAHPEHRKTHWEDEWTVFEVGTMPAVHLAGVLWTVLAVWGLEQQQQDSSSMPTVGPPDRQLQGAHCLQCEISMFQSQHSNGRGFDRAVGHCLGDGLGRMDLASVHQLLTEATAGPTLRTSLSAHHQQTAAAAAAAAKAAATANNQSCCKFNCSLHTAQGLPQHCTAN
jgi:hypothetical protein